MVKKQVLKTIKEYNLIEKNDHIIVGFSGGPDSLCLLHVLHSIQETLQFQMTAVHVHHGFRKEDADNDEKFCQKYCSAIDVPYRSFKYDGYAYAKENKFTPEEAGRHLRYRSFYSVMKEVNGNKIATAQNLNDQAETLLMRLMRGTGIDGLSGIEYVRKGFNYIPDAVLIRPLLGVGREAIEDYCKENNLDPVIDYTNFEKIYTRNKIRLSMIPFMESNFNENVVAALGRLSKSAKEDSSFLAEIADSFIAAHKLSSSCDKMTIQRDAFLSQHISIQKRVIMTSFEKIGLVQDIEGNHLESAVDLIVKGKASSMIHLPHGYRLRTSYDTIVFETSPGFSANTSAGHHSFEEYAYPVEPNKITIIPELNLKIEARILEKKDIVNNNDHGKISANTFCTDLQHQDCADLQPQDCADLQDQDCASALPALSTYDYADVRYFDLDKINGPLIVRSRREGDFIVPLGMKGSKKIKRLFIDEKIPKEQRDSFPLICFGKEVLWVPTKRISESYKVSADSERVLMLEISNHL